MDAPCYLLKLPTELRLEIYDYCLEGTQIVTVASAPVIATTRQDGQQQLLGDLHHEDDAGKEQGGTNSIPGLPANHVPLVAHRYDPALLSITDPIDLSLPRDAKLLAKLSPRIDSPFSTSQALLLTSKQINDELTDHMRSRAKAKPKIKSNNAPTTPSRRADEVSNGGVELYVSYPHGVLVLKHLYLDLLKQARAVYISGYYAWETQKSKGHATQLDQQTMLNRDMNTSRPEIRRARVSYSSGRLRLRMEDTLNSHVPAARKLLPYNREAAKLAPVALAEVVQAVLGRKSPLPFQKLECRIFYPDPDRYHSVWGDDNTPTSHTLRNVNGGQIGLETHRGSFGTGVNVVARPRPTGRFLTSSWHKLPSSSQIESEAWILGKHWGIEE